MLNAARSCVSWRGLRRPLRDAAFVARCRTVCQRNTGATPLILLTCFLFLQGIQTIALRMEQACRECAQSGEFLRAHPYCKWGGALELRGVS